MELLEDGGVGGAGEVSDGVVALTLASSWFLMPGEDSPICLHLLSQSSTRPDQIALFHASGAEDGG